MVNNEVLRLEFAARLNEAMADAGYPERGRAVAITSYMKLKGGKLSAVAAGKWLKGESMPAPPNMLVLADWLGVRREWLEYGISPKRATEGASQPNAVSGAAPSQGSPIAARLIRRILSLDAQGALTADAVKVIELNLKLAAQAAPRGESGDTYSETKIPGVLHKHTAEELFRKQAIQDNKEVIAEQATGHIRKIRGVKTPPRQQDDSGQKSDQK